MVELADIIRQHGSSYCQAYQQQLLPSQRRALFDIEHCRTGFFGGHVYSCTNQECRQLYYANHSCRNRSCPKCHKDQTEAWLEARQSELLPTPYFHLVFTVPSQLHAVARTHQKIVYSILMQETAASLRTLAQDPKYLGGDIAILEVLHTWTRAMLYHPHVHCLVPGGALTPDNTWVEANPAFLVPVHAAALIFRAKVKDALARAGLLDFVPANAWTKKWVVYSKPAVQGSEQVLRYLGRYVHRIAIVNSRIISCGENSVTYRYQDALTGTQELTLPAHQFLSRFLQHVLPRNFSKVRYYGLWAPANRSRLKGLQVTLGCQSDTEHTNITPEKTSKPEETQLQCPHCNHLLIKIDTLPRQRRPDFFIEARESRAPP